MQLCHKQQKGRFSSVKKITFMCIVTVETDSV